MQELERIVAEAGQAIAATASVADLEQAKARYLGKAGSLTELLKGLGKLSAEERPRAGAAINAAKTQVEALVQSRRDALQARELDARLAAEAGFADQSHLTRVFKRFTGLTPREYRTFRAFKTA